jgi:hypothetical protein
MILAQTARKTAILNEGQKLAQPGADIRAGKGISGAMLPAER